MATCLSIFSNGTIFRRAELKILILVFGNIILAAPSYAYLDPGTGSIILQSLLAGIAVAIGMLRMYWYRLKDFFRHIVGSHNEEAQQNSEHSSADNTSGSKDQI